MKKILVPTDFSACANHAVNFAVQSAKYLPIEITLLHSFEVKGNIYTDYLGVNKEFNQSMLTEANKKLNDLKIQIEKTEGVLVHTLISKKPLTTAVLEAAAENHIDLIVMGTLGASGLKEKLLGSNTGSVISQTRVPVMVIPFYYEWKKPEKLLLATNHFEKDPVILDYIFELADLYLAKSQVIVFTEEEGQNAFAMLEHHRKTPPYEKLLKEQYHQETLTATQLFGESFEDSLQEYINYNHIDILAMITYPRSSFWDKVFHPSITRRMSYHTKIPLLAIPAKSVYH
jgi:nucleotide-binding universal stress UspA family protein